MVRKLLLLLPILLLAAWLNAQEHGEKESEEGLKGYHQLSLMVSHTRIGEGYVAGVKRNIAVPSLGFDYNYWISRNWAIGLHSDLIMESFKIEESGGAIMERSTPFAAVPAVSFKPGNHSVFVFGTGREFAREGDYTLTRLGYEYSIELPKRFDLSFSFSYDFKWNAYNAMTAGIVVGKLFK